MDQRHPALPSPPPVSSLSRPRPRWPGLRRRTLRRLSRSHLGPPSTPHGAYMGAPRPHPLSQPRAAAASSFRFPGPAAAGLRPGGVCARPSCGAKSVARGRVLPAIAQIAGHQVGLLSRRQELAGRRPRSPTRP